MRGRLRHSRRCSAVDPSPVRPDTHGPRRLLEPPFGLRWGDSPEKLITWASRHSLDVTISLPGDQPGLRILKIEPRKGFLPETQAGAVEGRFLGGKLYELTVHYFDPGGLRGPDGSPFRGAAQTGRRSNTARCSPTSSSGRWRTNL